MVVYCNASFSCVTIGNNKKKGKTMNRALAIFAFAIFCGQSVNAQYTGVTSLQNKVLQDVSFSGTTTLDNVQAGSISASGPLKFNGLSVLGDTSVDGFVSGINGKFGTLNIRGSFIAKNLSA